MRILTVRQPWAWAIIHGVKDVENRSRNIVGSYRGPVAIHAAMKTEGIGPEDDATFRHFDRRYDTHLHNGAIVGVVDIVGVHESAAEGCGTGEGFGGLIPMCSEWARPWDHHIVLANARSIVEPIPYRGALGLRRLDDDTTARILEAVAA